MAMYYKNRHWRSCLIGADTFRAGATDQLLQTAAAGHIPCFVKKDERDPVKVAREGL